MVQKRRIPTPNSSHHCSPPGSDYQSHWAVNSTWFPPILLHHVTGPQPSLPSLSFPLRQSHRQLWVIYTQHQEEEIFSHWLYQLSCMARTSCKKFFQSQWRCLTCCNGRRCEYFMQLLHMGWLASFSISPMEDATVSTSVLLRTMLQPTLDKPWQQTYAWTDQLNDVHSCDGPTPHDWYSPNKSLSISMWNIRLCNGYLSWRHRMGANKHQIDQQQQPQLSHHASIPQTSEAAIM